MSVPVVLLLIAGLLVVVSLVQRLATRLALPASILFAILGIGIGAAATLALKGGLTGAAADFAAVFVNVPVTSDTFLYVLVPGLLFQSALTIDVRRVLEDAAPILLLAVVAVLVATAVIGVAMAPFASVSLVACLLLASIVSTTDTVAVIGIFRDVGAPARLCRLVEGESLLNDAAAIVTFTVLLNILTVGHATGVVAATAEFLWTFVGGVAVGYLATRVAVACLPWLEDLRLAQVTLTLALPYVVYIAGERGLGVSGVIAAVTAGLVMSATGQQRLTPNTWRFLLDLWEQLAYWASSLIFVLAAILVPRLLGDITWYDGLLLAIQIAAALAARALILYGILPLMSAVQWSRRVDGRYNLVILWGGLRGAVTLALALAITENTTLSLEVKRFIAVQATGFTLFTLLVQGLTLRPLIQKLGLDRLSPFDETLRAHVFAVSRERVAAEVQRIGLQYGFASALIRRVSDTYGAPATQAVVDRPTATLGIASDDEQLRLGLVALTQREREIVLEHFDGRVIAGRTVEELLGDVDHLLDRARTRGYGEYLRASEEQVGFSRYFRVAQFLHRRVHVDAPLVDRLADRFERLLVSRIVLESLAVHVDTVLAALVNEGVASHLREILAKRKAMTSASLDALSAQYPDYAALLEERFLRRVALQREEREYRTLFDERVIGPELFGSLQRDLQATRSGLRARPKLDLGLETRTLLARVPMLAALDDHHLAAVARLLRPRLAVPGERLITTGQTGDSMYFIAAGTVLVDLAQPVKLTSGDFFGEMALVLHQPRQANVDACSYCLLLVLDRGDFQSLLKSSRSIRERINQAAADRARMNEQ